MKALITALLVVCITIAIGGCGYDEEVLTEAYDKGYEAGYDKGYQKGWDDAYKEATRKAALTQVTPPKDTESLSAESITLKDASKLLDLTTILPSHFKKIDPATEGLSNADLQLGSEFSEIEAFLSDEPYQLIFGYIFLGKTEAEIALIDSMFKQKENVEALLNQYFIIGAEEEGLDISDVDVQFFVEYPDIGDFAVYGEGYAEAYGFSFGVDIIMFRIEKVYVGLCSSYTELGAESLVPISNEISKRIK